MEEPLSNSLPIRHVSKAAHEELTYMENRMNGTERSLITPWSKMNMATMNGLEWGSFNVIGGMSGSGKTAVLNELETGLFDLNADQPFTVLSFNFEMLARRLVGRKISKKLGKSVKQLYSADLEDQHRNLTKEDLDEARKYCDEHLSKYDLHYVDIAGTVAQIINTVTNHAMKPENLHKGVVVSLDHSILVRGVKGQEERQILVALGAAFNDLKKKLKIIFVIISQLNRDIEKVDRIQNQDLQFPQKSDVFGSDALWQFSDMFMISHRPEMLNIEFYGPLKWKTEGKIFWHFLKTRDGAPFISRLANDLKHNRMVEDP